MIAVIAGATFDALQAVRFCCGEECCELMENLLLASRGSSASPRLTFPKVIIFGGSQSAGREHSRCASSESYWIGIAVIAIEGGGVKVLRADQSTNLLL